MAWFLTPFPVEKRFHPYTYTKKMNQLILRFFFKEELVQPLPIVNLRSLDDDDDDDDGDDDDDDDDDGGDSSKSRIWSDLLAAIGILTTQESLFEPLKLGEFSFCQVERWGVIGMGIRIWIYLVKL